MQHKEQDPSLTLDKIEDFLRFLSDSTFKAEAHRELSQACFLAFLAYLEGQLKPRSQNMMVKRLESLLKLDYFQTFALLLKTLVADIKNGGVDLKALQKQMPDEWDNSVDALRREHQDKINASISHKGIEGLKLKAGHELFEVQGLSTSLEMESKTPAPHALQTAEKHDKAAKALMKNHKYQEAGIAWQKALDELGEADSSTEGLEEKRLYYFSKLNLATLKQSEANFSFEVLIVLAETNLKKKDYAKASQQLEKAIQDIYRKYPSVPPPQISKQLTECYEGLGLAQEQLGRLNKARSALYTANEFIHLNQEEPDLKAARQAKLYTRIADLEYRLANPKRALKYWYLALKRWTQVQGSRPELELAKAQLQEKLQNTSEQLRIRAESYSNRALELLNQNEEIQALVTIGRAIHELEQLPEGVMTNRDREELGNHFGRLGDLHQALEQDDQALLAWDKALKYLSPLEPYYLLYLYHGKMAQTFDTKDDLSQAFKHHSLALDYLLKIPEVTETIQDEIELTQTELDYCRRRLHQEEERPGQQARSKPPKV